MICGVTAEFNPFHKGHNYLLKTLKSAGEKTVCVIGDDFTQRGDTAIISKYARAEAALRCGADLCLLLPVAWSAANAAAFARGAVGIMRSLGAVDTIAFGSECGDIDKLKNISRLSHGNDDEIKKRLKTGVTFARARQDALFDKIGADAKILSDANDILATEYIHAADNAGFSPRFIAVKRRGALHDGDERDGFLSAAKIRELIYSGCTAEAEKYMPPAAFQVLLREKSFGRISRLENIEKAILSKLRETSAEQFSALPEISEGLHNRLFAAARTAASLEECFSLIKTKRYTLSRVRRMVISAYLGLTADDAAGEPPYIRVLGFTPDGEQILRNAKPTVPIITRGKDYLSLTGRAAECFEKQSRAADLYALSLERPTACGGELSAKIIRG